MKALQYDRYGEPSDVVTAAAADEPQPEAGEVRLRLIRSPIHNHDLATIRGRYGFKPSLPAIGGSEMLGAVDARGSGVTSLRDGQRVVAMVRGAWAEYAIARADDAVPVPDEISDDDGAQLLAMPLSAIVLFESLRVARGDWIVQNAANGAVGRILLRLATEAGVHVVNVVRREEAVNELRGYGAEHVVDSEKADWERRAREIAGDKIVRVVDAVCDAHSLVLNRMLAPAGEHVIFGALAGRALSLDPGALIFGETVVRGFWMTVWFFRASREERVRAIARVLDLARSGKLPLSVGGVYSLDEAEGALAHGERSGRGGKVLFKA